GRGFSRPRREPIFGVGGTLMKSIIMTAAALALLGCNREAKHEYRDSDKQASAWEQKPVTGRAAEARQTGRDVSEGSDQAMDKTREEARQTGRDISEGTAKSTDKMREESRQ